MSIRLTLIINLDHKMKNIGLQVSLTMTLTNKISAQSKDESGDRCKNNTMILLGNSL
jgi:hypothetical protein